jgi:hypothetical protein
MESKAQVSRSPVSRTSIVVGTTAASGEPSHSSLFPSPAPSPLRRWAALGVLVLLCLIGLLALLPPAPRDGQAHGAPQETGAATPAANPPLFLGWTKPDLVLVLSGEQRGYLQPCGCSRPQLGGMARRYNFIQTLKKRGWPVVAVDLGDIAPQQNGPQKMLKYVTAMKGLDLLGYSAIGIGANEMAMPTIEALGNYSLNHPTPPVLAANVSLEGPGHMFRGLVHPWVIAHKEAPPRVGITALIGASLAGKDPAVKLVPRARQLLGELKAQKVDLVVLLFDGSFNEAKACAEFCARCRQADKTLPAVDVMMCLSGEEDEPPGVPDHVGRTLVIRLGHKARYVGVVGAFATGQPAAPCKLRYQLVPLGEEYETKEGQEASNPIMALMEDYAKEVKRGNYLARYPRSLHPVQIAFPEKEPEYVGTAICAGCHKDEYQVWKNSAHSHAYESLVKATHPSLRQYDGECVVCHVVGFKYKTGFTDEVKTAFLKDVGCESCHGPGSAHVAKPRDKDIQKAMNPYRRPDGIEPPQARRIRHLKIDKFCQSCHDIDNDVHWDFDKNWPKIVHTMKRRAQAAATPAAQPEPAITAPSSESPKR